MVGNPSFVAGGDIRPCRFVTQDPSNDYKVLESNANDRPIGISQEGYRAPNLPDQTAQTLAAQDGDQVTIYGEGEICLLEINDTIVAGNLLKPDANGLGVLAETDGDATGAEALESGAANDKIRVIVRPERKYA